MTETVPRTSTTNEDRVCRALATQRGRGYCGRRSAPTVDDWAHVVCNDCRAAARADGIRA